MSEGGIPLREYVNDRFEQVDRRIDGVEQKLLTHVNDRFSEHGRQHAMEQASYSEFKGEVKDALKELTSEVGSIRMTVGKASAIVGAAIVVAGFVIKFF